MLFSTPVNSPATANSALAMLEAGWLESYFTTLAFGQDSRWLAAADWIDRRFGGRLAAELRRRQAGQIPSRLIHSFPWLEAARTGLARTGLAGARLSSFSRLALDGFDRHVAARLGSAGSVYAYRGAALHTFQAAARLGLRRIYNVGGLEPGTVAATLGRELSIWGGGQSPPPPEPDPAWSMAELIIVNSNLTRETHRLAGWDVGAVKVVPLGFPPTMASARAAPEGRLKVLWAGNFSLMKGAPYFLTALQAVGGGIEVRVFGSPQWPRPDGVTSLEIFPTIPRERLFAEYRRADVLVAPTLADGFGMVISEAMSQGLPVITTPLAGASEFIRSGENGLIVPAADAEALAGALAWCVDHRGDLAGLGEAARATAAGWQWTDYRRALTGAMAEP